MKIKIILAILVGIIELSAAQADNTEKSNTENVSQDTQKESACLAPYGIKLGQTTIEEVKMKFSVLRTKKTEIGNTLYLDPKNFGIENCIANGVIVATIGSSNIVECIYIQFSGKYYTVLKEILGQKYNIVSSREKSNEDYLCILQEKGNTKQSVYLHQTEISTAIMYETNKYKKATRRENISQNTQDEAPCPAPYGIKLGQTTVEEIKRKFSVLDTKEMKIGDVSFPSYALDPVDFNVGNLTAKEVNIVTIGDSNIVEAVGVVFKGKCYADLKRILAKKYQVIKSEEPFVGDYYCLLRGKDQSIEIIQDHLDFDTLLRYTTKNIREIVTNAKETERRKDTAAMEDKL